MKNYFKLISEWKRPEDVLNFIKDFEYFIDGAVSIRVNNRPPLMDLETITLEKKGTCANTSYFIIKTLNFMDKNYCSFGLHYSWGERIDENGIVHEKPVIIASNKLPIWFEDNKIYFMYFSNLNYKTIHKRGPFLSYEELNQQIEKMSKKSMDLVDPNSKVEKGISIIDVRVANDSRLLEAIKFFGVDNQYSWYKR